MTSPSQFHQFVAQSHLASKIAERRRRQTRQLVTASQQRCVQSRRALTDPRRALLWASAPDGVPPSMPGQAAARRQLEQPAEPSSVAPTAPLPTSARRGRDAQ